MKRVGIRAHSAFMGWVIIALAIIVGALAIAVVMLLQRPTVVVSNFDQCVKAGGAILETYPEQCLINGTTFASVPRPVNSDGYVGITEGEALAKAKQANTPARVVERDGTTQPITMDFVFGRHNLFVKNGAVYKVEIEGQAKDQ